jgi:hypothetical protein
MVITVKYCQCAPTDDGQGARVRRDNRTRRRKRQNGCATLPSHRSLSSHQASKPKTEIECMHGLRNRSRPLPALQSWDGDLGGLTCRDQPPHPNTLTSRSSREGLSEQNPRSRNPSHAHHKKRLSKDYKTRMTHPNIRFISWSSSFAHFPHHHVWIRGVQRRLVPWGGDWSSGRDWRVHLHPSAY